MAATIGTLAVKIAALTADFNRDVDGASKRLGKISKSAATVAKRSAVAFAGMSGALAVVTKFASEQIRVERQLSTAFEATGQSLDITAFKEFATGLQGVTTTGDEVIIGLGAMMASFGLAQNQIQGLLPGILDLAAATGKSADTISRQLSRAIVEGVGDLGRYGIFLTKAEKQTLKLGTQAERTALLIGKMSGAQGAASVAATTAAGRTQQFTNSLGDVLEEIGKIVDAPLASIFEAMRDAANSVAGAISNLSPQMKTVAGAVAIGGTAVVGLVAGLASMVAVLPFVATGLTTALGIMKALTAQITATRVATLGLVAIFAALAAGILGAVKTIKDLLIIREEGLFSAAGAGAAERLARSGIDPEGPGETGVVERLGIAATGSFKRGFQEIGDLISETTKEFVGLDGQLSTTTGAVVDLGKAGKTTAKALTKAAGEFDFAGTTVEGIDIQGGVDAALNQLTPEQAALATAGGLAGPAGVGQVARAPIDIGIGRTAARDFEKAADEAAKQVKVGARDLGFGIKIGLDEAGNQVGSAVGNAAKTFAADMLSASGDVGEVVNAAAQGFAAGGPFGALAAVGANLLQRTESFKATVDDGNEAVAELASAMEPLAKGIRPLAAAIFDIVGIISENLTPVFEALGPVFKFVGLGIRGIAIGIISVFKAYFDAFNTVIQSLENLINKIPGIDIDLGRLQINTRGLGRALDRLRDTSLDSVEAASEELDQRREATEESGRAASAMRSLTAQLTNVPGGFRAELTRFRSTTPGLGDPNERIDPRQRMIQINITANDSQDVADKVRLVVREENFDTAGSSEAASLEFSVDRKGA